MGQSIVIATSPKLVPRAQQSLWTRVRRSQTVLAYLMNAPMLILLAVIVAFPIGYSFWLSVESYNLRRPNNIHFIGLGNYLFILQGEEFWSTLKTTLIFSVGSISIEICIGLLLALLLNEEFVGRGVLRSMVLLPWAIPGVVGGIMWQWFFNPSVGFWNGVLYSLHLISTYQNYFLNVTTAMGVLIFAQVWGSAPFTALVFLAALQSVPRDMYEAARVDGAAVFERFWYITRPWLLQPLLLIVIVSTMGSLRVFDLVYVLTGGGPGTSTQVLMFTAYKKAFDALDFGTANAYAYILAIMTLAFGLVYMKVLFARGEIEQ